MRGQGEGVGGTFAFYLGFNNQKLFRSVVALDAEMAMRMKPPVVHPNRPQLVYWSLSDEKAAHRSATIVEVLKDMKFPLRFVAGKKPSELREEVLNLVESLDRL